MVIFPREAQTMQISNSPAVSRISRLIWNVGRGKEASIAPLPGWQCSSLTVHQCLNTHPLLNITFTCDDRIVYFMTLEISATLTIVNLWCNARRASASLVSTNAIVFNLTIATYNLRAFHYCGPFPPPMEPLLLLLHTMGWVFHPIAHNAQKVPWCAASSWKIPSTLRAHFRKIVILSKKPNAFHSATFHSARTFSIRLLKYKKLSTYNI